jgi:hypothetical protein
MRPIALKWDVIQNPNCAQLEVIGQFMAKDGKVTEISRQVPVFGRYGAPPEDSRTRAWVANAQASITAEYEFTEKYGWLKSL